MYRYALGLVFASLLLTGCDNGNPGPANPPSKTTTRHTTIETPNGEVNIHRQKTETPDGTKQRHIEIERKNR